jgi:hypothetical protein
MFCEVCTHREALDARIKELETHKADDLAARMLEREGLRVRIRELEEGSCRYNCRTAKQAFLAGFNAGAEDAWDAGKIIDDDLHAKTVNDAYKKWLGERE